MEDSQLRRPMDSGPSLELRIAEPAVVFICLQSLHGLALRDATQEVGEAEQGFDRGGTSTCDMPKHSPRHGLVDGRSLRRTFLLQRQRLVERFNRRLDFAVGHPTIAFSLRLAIDDAVERDLTGLVLGGLFQWAGKDADLVAS